MEIDMNPYTLPTIQFVGGETQALAFSIYSHTKDKPCSMTGCTANFSIVSFMNKWGTPMISKTMAAVMNAAGTVDNVLTVSILPEETVNLTGKYIYQISIRDAKGTVEIPKQGILMIANNINKSFLGN